MDFVLLGYARAATDSEALRLQHHALAVEGCGRILVEQLAPRGDSPGPGAILDELGPGDTLVICRLEVLGRSLEELVDYANALRLRGVGLRSLAERIDTDAPDGGTVYDLFGALAAFRRGADPYGDRPAAVSARRPFPSQSAQSGSAGDAVATHESRTWTARREGRSMAARKRIRTEA